MGCSVDPHVVPLSLRVVRCNLTSAGVRSEWSAREQLLARDAIRSNRFARNVVRETDVPGDVLVTPESPGLSVHRRRRVLLLNAVRRLTQLSRVRRERPGGTVLREWDPGEHNRG